MITYCNDYFCLNLAMPLRMIALMMGRFKSSILFFATTQDHVILTHYTTIDFGDYCNINLLDGSIHINTIVRRRQTYDLKVWDTRICRKSS